MSGRAAPGPSALPSSSGLATHAAGRVKKKVEPAPGVDLTRIVPPCWSGSDGI
ncbi:MAG: hypothetical protein ABFC89_09210 [Methanospirillum sp.]